MKSSRSKGRSNGGMKKGAAGKRKTTSKSKSSSMGSRSTMRSRSARGAAMKPRTSTKRCAGTMMEGEGQGTMSGWPREQAATPASSQRLSPRVR